MQKDDSYGSGSWRVSGRPQPAAPVDPPGAPELPQSAEPFRVERPTRRPSFNSVLSDVVEAVNKPAVNTPDHVSNNPEPQPRQKLHIPDSTDHQPKQPKARLQKLSVKRFKRPQVSTHQPKPVPAAAAPKSDTNVTININLPKLRKPTLPDWPWRRLALYGAILVAVFVAGLGVRAGVQAAIRHHREEQAKHRLDTIQQNKRVNPNFKPLVPARNATVAKTAGYDGVRNTYSYNDTIKGMAVTVSQQPLPAGGSADAVLAKIAKGMNANTPLALSHGTAFMASNSSGAQTIVMSTNSMLVFAQSAFKLSTEDWRAYLDSLSV